MVALFCSDHSKVMHAPKNATNKNHHRDIFYDEKLLYKGVNVKHSFKNKRTITEARILNF